MALFFRRRIEEDVRDPFGRQIEVDVLRVAVGRAHLSVLELVAAFRVGLDQPDDVMLADEAEPAVSNLHGGQEVSPGPPPPRGPLQGGPLPGMSQNARPRAAAGVDLLLVQGETGLAP